MNCMKCGREIQGDQVFCEACLKDMSAYPVKPGTPVNIPKRPQKKAVEPVKKEKPEELIAQLRKTIRVWRVTVLVLLLLLILSVSLLGWHYATTDHSRPAIGQNYSTETQNPSP